MKIEPVESLGKKKIMAFVRRTDGTSGVDEVEVDSYPPSEDGESLRILRVSLSMSLRKAADALGVSVIELSGLERGSHRPAGPHNWNEVRDIIREAAGIQMET